MVQAHALPDQPLDDTLPLLFLLPPVPLRIMSPSPQSIQNQARLSGTTINFLGPRTEQLQYFDK